MAQDSQWPYQKVADNFHFHSDGPLDDLETLVDGVSQLPKDLKEKLGLDCAPACIHIVLFRTESEYQRYMQHYFPQVPLRRALFIRDRGPGIVFAFRHPEIMVDLRHECTHALLQDAFPEIPLWLDEGLAEYFEAFESGNTYHTCHAPLIHAQSKLGQVPAIEELERCTASGQMDTRKYSDAWSWVHYLLEGNEEGAHLLNCYLQDVKTNPLSAGPFSARLRRSIPNGRYAYLDHFKKLEAPKPALLAERPAANEKTR